MSESIPTMHTRPSGISKRVTHRKDNGTREPFTASFTPEHGNRWSCLLEDLDGNKYHAECDRPASALNSAISKYNEATGRTRLGRVC